MNAAVVVVSGKPSDGVEFMPYLEVGSLSAVRRIILILHQAGIDRVVLVSSGDVEELEHHVARMGAICLGGEPGTDMLGNIKTGLGYLRGHYSRVVITPVDVPLFSAETVRMLLSQTADAAVPVHSGMPGHPVMIGGAVIDAVLAYEEPGGLDCALRAVTRDIAYPEVSDPGVLYDVEARDSDELSSIAAGHELSKIRTELRVSLARDKAFFGPGTQTLLELVCETGSLSVACSRMAISYSKGRKMVQLLEEQLGFPVISSQKGGANGGHSALTARGQAFIDRYAHLVRRSRDAVDEIFVELFCDMD